ncbi:hypothetical protein CRM22_009744 [Opisthorchis felineus]|uniref:Uncharacterized protein n=1 Tax=Opisthorchis felineus TaxID=147828 RepID=A0A4S2L5W9_OPIFE|nr:hypothetical protein CRM22_009744 [Opisthorchis felineus]
MVGRHACNTTSVPNRTTKAASTPSQTHSLALDARCAPSVFTRTCTLIATWLSILDRMRTVGIASTANAQFIRIQPVDSTALAQANVPVRDKTIIVLACPFATNYSGRSREPQHPNLSS